MTLDQTETLPLVELMRGTTRTAVVAWVLREADPDEEYRMGELMKATDLSREGLRQNLDALVTFGILDVRGPDKPIPHYSVGDSPVVEALRAYHETDMVDLTELLDTTSKRRLVQFFLTRADGDESFSKSRLDRESGVGYNGITSSLPDLVEAGLLREVEGSWGTEYQLVEDGELVAWLVRLNEIAFETYNDRAD